MHIFGLAILCAFILSCSPEGELTRTLHTPHQRYLDRQNPLAAKKAEGPAALSGGLPSACSKASSDPLCLSCEEDSSLVLRCYDYKEAWAPETDCHHNAELIKCLMKDPAFALLLDYRNSDEQLFNENVKVWTEAVERIWDDKLSEDEKAESRRISGALMIIAEIVTKKLVIDSTDRLRFHEALAFVTPEQQALSAKFLDQVHIDRISGRLQLSTVLKNLRDLVKETHGPSLLLEKLGTMSLESLEVE